MRFAIVLSHVSKVLRLPRKSGARSYEVPWLSCKIILADLKIWCSKMQPLSGNLLPDLRTCLGCLLYCACHATCIFADVARLPSFFNVFEKTKKPTRLTMFDKVPNLLCFSHFDAACFFCTSQLPKVIRTVPDLRHFAHFDFVMCFAPQRSAFFQKCSGVEVFCTFWLRNVLRATAACIFPKVLRGRGAFVHSDFKMCFVPQRRALFDISTPKRARNLRFCTFWLRNACRATMVCSFVTSQRLQVLQRWGAFDIFTSKCASRRNGVQFLIAQLTTALVSLFFDPPEPQNIGKTQCFAILPFRAPASFFFWFFLFSDLLSSSFLFSDSSHLCFPICPYCRKFDYWAPFDDM